MFIIALGLACLIIGVYLLILFPVQSSQLKRRTGEASGYVTEVREIRRRRHGTTYSLDVEYTADGMQYLLKKVKWPLPPEQKYTISYNPAKPEDAHVKEFRTANPKVFLVIGAILPLVGVALVVIGR